MRHTQLNSERPIQSVGRELFSLKVDDIPGARPRVINATKNINHYHQRMVEDGVQFKDYVENYQHKNNDDIIFGTGRLYPERKVGRIGKKQYDRHWISEIKETDTLKGSHNANQPVQSFDYPRSLAIHDIPGAVVGSSKSQALKNHALAEKLRRDNSAPRPRPTNNDSRRADDSLDRFYKERSVMGNSIGGDSNGCSGATYHSLFPENDQLDSHRPGLNVTSSMKDMREERQGIEQPLRTERPPSGQARIKNVPYYFPPHENDSMAGIPSELTRIMRKETRGYGRKISMQGDSQASERGSEHSGGFKNTRDYDQVAIREFEEIPKKKIMTFNIISNTANSKQVPQNAIIPEKYAYPHNFQNNGGAAAGERRSSQIAPSLNNGSGVGSQTNIGSQNNIGSQQNLANPVNEGGNQKFQLIRNLIYQDQMKRAQNQSQPMNDYTQRPPINYQRRMSQGV